jgi:hypothetical protein
MNLSEFPPEFSELVGKINYLVQVNENEFHASCPNCGGEIHQDGSYPDRFVLWKVSRRGNVFGMCIRKCGYRWSPNKSDALWTADERAEFARKQAQMEAEWMQAEAERIEKLAQLVTSQLVWKRCFDDAPESAKEYWEKKRGIPRDWQQELWLGCLEEYTVRGLTSYKSEAYTIPVFNFEGAIENITLRVARPQSSNDRYRRMYKSKAQHLHSPQRRKANKIVLMEGEIKANITTIYTPLPEDMTVYGVQSKSPERRILKSLDFAEVVYIAFDYDAYVPDPKSGRIAVIEAAKQIGMERVRFVVPPKKCKFDDAILQGYQFKNAVNMSVRSFQ